MRATSRKAVLWSVLLTLSCLFGKVARAEAPTPALRNAERPHRLWIRGVGYTGKLESDRLILLAPRFGGAFLLGDMFDLDIEVPFLHTSIEQKAEERSESRTRPGNPFIGLSRVVARRWFQMSIGGGAAAPLATDKKSDPFDDISYRYARAARAGREAWLYTPNRLGLVLHGEIEAKLDHGPLLGGDAGVGLMPRVRGDGRTLLGTTQVGLWIAAELANGVRLGGRIDAVLLSAEERERSQLALVPFVSVEAESGLLFRAEFIANLDNPYGFAFEEGGIWGASLLAGSRF